MLKCLILLVALSGCADHISDINKKVNANKYSKQYDCRAFAMEKYKELIKAGYKDNDIRFIITDYKSQPHVVLRVNGVILDNLVSEPYPATKALQGGLAPSEWIKANTPI